MRSRSSVYNATAPPASGTAKALSMNSIWLQGETGANGSDAATRSPVFASIATTASPASAYARVEDPIWRKATGPSASAGKRHATPPDSGAETGTQPGTMATGAVVA